VEHMVRGTNKILAWGPADGSRTERWPEMTVQIKGRDATRRSSVRDVIAI
jgi:hypothetical protein